MRYILFFIFFIHLHITPIYSSERIGYIKYNKLFHLVDDVIDCHIVKESNAIYTAHLHIQEHRRTLKIQYYGGIIEQSLKHKIDFLEKQLINKKLDLWEYKKHLFYNDVQKLVQQLQYSYEINNIYIIESVTDLKGHRNFIPKKNWFNLTIEFLSVYNKEKRGVKYEVFRKKSCT